jgi:N-acetylmuramoyl-L-alanine amidase
LYANIAVLVIQAASMQILDGWATGAARAPSPNFEAGHRSRECVVLHYTASYTAASAIATFANPAARASAHFVVGTDGAVTQMVSCADTAWHAGHGLFRGQGRVNSRAIGIEIVNPGYHHRDADGRLLNWQRKPVPQARLAPFPGWLEARDPWVGSAAVLWPFFPEAQLHAVEQILRACIGAYPGLCAIVGHRDVDSVRRLKVDPGPAFPMQRMQRLLAGAAPKA